MFSPELLRLIAAICDTKRIPKSKDKMFVLSNLLYTYDIYFEFLGGATNRLALLMDGYAVKFAVEDQGFRDNLIEYSLSPELQPYVTKSYETNGYIQVAEFVEVIKDVSTFQAHKTEIIKILDILGQDHLLGDVGFLIKNMTNWGIRDGHPVILDYAYCHRFTENLFTCDRCGQPLIYDQTYDKLMCSDRCMCKAVYSYNERKRVQGKQIDNDMIEQRKTESIIMGPGEVEKDIQCLDDILVGGNKFVINNAYDEFIYDQMREEKLMQAMFSNGNQNQMEMLIQLARDPHNVELRKTFFDIPTIGMPEAVYTEDYENGMLEDDEDDVFYDPDAKSEDDDESDLNDDVGDVPSLSDLIAMARRTTLPTLRLRSTVPEHIERIFEQIRLANMANKRRAAQNNTKTDHDIDDDGVAEKEEDEPVDDQKDSVGGSEQEGLITPTTPGNDIKNTSTVAKNDDSSLESTTHAEPEILINMSPIRNGEEMEVSR